MIRTVIISVFRLFEPEIILVGPAERVAWLVTPETPLASPFEEYYRHRKMTWKSAVPG